MWTYVHGTQLTINMDEGDAGEADDVFEHNKAAGR